MRGVTTPATIVAVPTLFAVVARSFVRSLWMRLNASVVAMDPLVLLVPLLRLDRHRRNRAGFEAAQRDRLAGDLAIAIGAVVDARDSGIDLGDELALAVARPELDRAVGLGGGTIG